MPSTVFDSTIFRDLFGTAEMRAIFSDEALVARYLEVETTLARVQADLGIIPVEAADAIAEGAVPDNIDMDELGRATGLVGYPILPLVQQVARACRDGLGEYVHWGATTQDIMDTAVALQVKAAFELIEADLAALSEILADLARRHRDTPMPGRTHLQQALPVTFGYKAAVWLSGIERHRARLAEIRPRATVGQFAGAAGTLASLGKDGFAVQEALMEALGLGRPRCPWHAMRDGFAEAVCFLGLVTGTLAKIATDVMLMMQTEIGEAFEPFLPGRGASSTMPQKRNPIACERILAAAATVRGDAETMLAATVQDHERATGPWQYEWVALPRAFIAASGALRCAREMLDGLEIDAARMRHNLDATHGLIVAEAVMMALAPHIGRQRAHDLVYDACRVAASEDRPLLEVLRGLDEVTRHLDAEDLVRLVDPARYVGLAAEIVDRVLAGAG